LQIPLADLRLVHQEFSQFEVFSRGDSSFIEVALEQLVGQLPPEFGVEGPAVRDKGASLGNISDELALGQRELVPLCNPPDLVVGEGVDQTVRLVHLLLGFGCLFIERLLLALCGVEFGLESALQLNDLSEFFLGVVQFGLSLLEGILLLLHKSQLWVYDLRSLVIVAHSFSPGGQTFERG